MGGKRRRRGEKEGEKKREKKKREKKRKDSHLRIPPKEQENYVYRYDRSSDNLFRKCHLLNRGKNRDIHNNVEGGNKRRVNG
jgi:hypothetical protein